MKKKHKLLAVIAIIAILVPIFEGLFSISSIWKTSANEPVAESIIASDFLNVTHEHTVTDEAVTWKVNYHLDIPDEIADTGELIAEKAGKLKFSLPETLAEGVSVPENTFVKQEDGWYVLKDFTKQTEGTIEITAAKDVVFEMFFQMDEQALLPTVELVDEDVEVILDDGTKGTEIQQREVHDKEELISLDILNEGAPVQYEFDLANYVTNESLALKKANTNTGGGGNTGGLLSGNKKTNAGDGDGKNSLEEPLENVTTYEVPPTPDFNIRTKKKARLATHDGTKQLTPKEAWEQRLYEVELEVLADSVPGEMEGNLIIYVDSSGSTNGGQRAADIARATRAIIAGMDPASNFTITFLPVAPYDQQGSYATAMGNAVDGSQLYGRPCTIAELNDMSTDYTFQDGKMKGYQQKTDVPMLEKILLEIQHSNKANNTKALGGPLQSAKTDSPKNIDLGILNGEDKSVGILIAGTDINDSADVLAKRTTNGFDDHEAFIAAFTDEKQPLNSGKMANWNKLLDGNDEFYFNSTDGLVDYDIILKAFEKAREVLTVSMLKVKDTIPDYFEIVTTSSDENIVISEDKKTITYNNQEMVAPTTEGESYSWNQTFLVKAKEDFIGGNVVAINEGAEVFVDSTDTGIPFDIYGEAKDGKDVIYENLETPYVNVKVPDELVETDETILLGQAAKDEAIIKEGWQAAVYDNYRNPDGTFKYGADPTIVFDALSPAYVKNPTTAGTYPYTSDGTLTPNNFTDDSLAKTYVEKYGTVPTANQVPTIPNHQGAIDAKHTTIVLDTTFEITKTLNGKTTLPDWFSADFLLAIAQGKTGYVNDDGNEFTINQTNVSGTFTGLGLGEYTITETLGNKETKERVKAPETLTLAITAGATDENGKPTFVLMINNEPVTDNKFTLNNPLKDVTLSLLKTDKNTDEELEGVTFALYELDDIGNPITATNLFGTENATIADGTLKLPAGEYLIPGKSYQLVELQGLPDYIPHQLTYTIKVDDEGGVTITSDDPNYDLGSVSYTETGATIDVALEIENIQEGMLPATGGEGIQQFIMISLVMLAIVGGLGAFYVYRNKKGGA